MHADKRMRSVFVFAAVLGLRNSEIRRLVWRDVDLAAGRLRVDMLHAKNRCDRVLSIPEPVVEILRDYRAGLSAAGASDFVFINRRGAPLTDYGLAKTARRVWEATGLLEGRPGTKVLHDLRATAATFMLETGASMETLRMNLGWKSREVVERYVKAFETSRSRAVEAMARELL